jgi:rhodanese-related sulfurtransferase
MRKIATYFVLLFVAAFTLSSFGKVEITNDNPPTEFELLVQYLEENGNFINTLSPAIIKADEIKENLKNKKYLVLDIRSEAWFEYGHIKNAKNVKGPELLNYFNNDITPADYDKITIVCYSGQSASYYTSLLRLYGFDNVYSLKWGISSWDSELAARYWGKNSIDNAEATLETTANPMPEKGTAMPVLSTGKTDAQEILKTRIEEAFAKPYKEFIVKSPDVFADPAALFIMNYVNKERYDFNHIKGAVQYEPKSLSTDANLFTLPTDKKILVACDTGLSAAYVVAYLHVLGYEVGNLAYGSNSYMNSTLVEKGWNGFSEKEVKDYTLVE